MNIRHPFVKLAALGALVTALPLLMAPTGGYPSNPQFQTVRIAPAVANGNTSPLTVNGFISQNGNTNAFTQTDTSQATLNRVWDIANFSGGWHFRACNDTIASCGSDAITVSRSGISPTNVAIGPALSTLDVIDRGTCGTAGRG